MAAAHTIAVHQLLHGYSEGHRLLASSIRLPEELTRIVLRMSDLSGANIVEGFEQYLTGYPLPALDAYAFAQTWYAPEMRRPGCVWTHTLVIPESALISVKRLHPFLGLFRRPGVDWSQEPYRAEIQVDTLELEEMPSLGGDLRKRLAALMEDFYGDPDYPLLAEATSSRQFEEVVMALWSQQWPSLRREFTFSTGSLSARFIGSRPIDFQCVPNQLMREVLRDTRLNLRLRLHEPSEAKTQWALVAAKSATSKEDEVRQFLWDVADQGSGRESYSGFAAVFVILSTPEMINRTSAVVQAIGHIFPKADDASRMKDTILGPPGIRVDWGPDEYEILHEIATCEDYRAFDPQALQFARRARELWSTDPESAQNLMRDCFEEDLNSIGAEILRGLISGLNVADAKPLADKRPSLLPELFRINPRLATAASLWDDSRAQELYDAVATSSELSVELEARVVRAVLRAGIKGIEDRILTRWTDVAVQEVLQWLDTHNGQLGDAWRVPLAARAAEILDWLGSNSSVSVATLLFLVRVLNPTDPEVRQHDSRVWLNALERISKEENPAHFAPVFAFALSLGFGNAPPHPVKLVCRSFAYIHQLAAMDQLGYESWLMLEQYLPRLSWTRNWDKCERLQRGLINAFVKYEWPPSELLRCMSDTAALELVQKSARKVEGGKRLMEQIVDQIEAGKVSVSPEQRSVLRSS